MIRLTSAPIDGWESGSTARTDRLDGDVEGESTTLTAEIQLTVCAPAPVAGTPHQ
jgi:hypothetical protein